MNSVEKLRMSMILLVELLTRNGLENKRRYIIKHKLTDIVELAFKNKVPLLLYERLQQFELNKHLPEHYRTRIRRLREKLRLYMKIMDELMRLAFNNSIDLVFVKTIKPFEYVGDDIDVLTSKEDYSKLIELARKKLNFKVEGWGPSETTLYKYIGGAKLMLDIHYKLASSSMSYVDTSNVLKMKKMISIEYEGITTKVPIPIPEYSILITSAHALLKELRINLADLLEINMRLKSCNTRLLQKLATNEGLKNTLHTMSKYLRKLHNIYDIPLLPCNIEPIELTKCYMEKIINRLKKGKLVEVLGLPLTNIKGYGILIKYLGRVYG